MFFAVKHTSKNNLKYNSNIFPKNDVLYYWFINFKTIFQYFLNNILEIYKKKNYNFNKIKNLKN